MDKTIRTPHPTRPCSRGVASLTLSILAAGLLWPAAAVAAPQFLSITPAGGTLTSASQVTLAGTLQDAVSLTIDGVPVSLDGQSFSETLALQDGTTSFLLVATDALDAETQIVHQVVRDSTPPSLTVSQPAGAAVLAGSPVSVQGTAVDPHLSEVLVDGVPATLDGASFSLSVALDPGVRTLTVAATDAVGNSSTSQVTVTYDPQPPAVAFSEGGSALGDGAAFNRAVVPVVDVGDNVAVATVEALLNGAPFTSGTTVSAEGVYTLSATATDTAGNSGQAQISFSIDLTPPSIGTISPADGTLTAAAEVTLSGTVTGAESVSVDGAPAIHDGASFTAGPLLLTDGVEHTFTVVATDAVGNSSQRPHRVERDSTAPAITVATPADGSATSAATVTVSGTAVDPHLTEVRVAGQPASLTGESFSLAAAALAEGVNTIDVDATDAADNSSTAQVTVTLDTLAPQVRILEGGVDLLDGAFFSGGVTPVIEVTDASDVTYEATLNGAAFTSGTTLGADGTYELSVTATDALDHSASLTVTFTLDNAPPEVLSIDPAEGLLTTAAEVTISGQVTGASTVSVNGQPATLTGEFFSLGPLPLAADGEHTFTVVASDASGNTTEASRRVVRDTTAPTLGVGQPAAGAVASAAAVDFSGTVNEANLVSLRVNALEATVTGTGWVALQVPLVEGENDVVVTAEDEVGLAAEVTRTVVLDTQDPTIAITDPAPGTVVPEEEITLSGTASDPHLDRVEVDGRPASLDGGTWTVTVDLEPGANDLTARAFDTLGHSADAALMVMRDSTSPSIQIEAPAEGLVTPAASVEVSGTVDDEPGLTVTVNGVAADVAAGAFAATVELTQEGENRLVARATDSLGNQGTHTRTVRRDTTAPEWLSASPADGALAVPTGSAFRLTFSERLADPASGSWTLETAAGTAIAAGAAFDGDVLVVTPDSPLPSETELRLELTSDLADDAGNALVNPLTLAYTTADVGAPGAPALAVAPALYQCAAAVTLSGTTEPEAVVRVTGGAATVEVRADDAGAFSLEVPLVPDRLNHLVVVAVDTNANASPAAVADVVQDCEAPRVAGAEREGDVITLTFSETVAAATVEPAVTVADAAGVVSGTVAVAAETATFTAAAALPEDGVRLEVAQLVTDLAGNLLAFPYARLFGDGTGASFFSGTAIDNATGRPLAGARVVVTASGGAALPDPQPEQVTGADGSFLLAVDAGTHDVTIARPGYSPVFRIVTTVAGQGTDVFDPRLTPAGAAATVPASGGTVAGENAVALTVPSTALSAPLDVTLTSLGEQGLTALLPYGWSPRSAVWLDLATDLSDDATLTLPVESPSGTVLTLAELDLATLQWRAVTSVTASGGLVSAGVATTGAYAALEADTGALAPPSPVDGEVLGSAPVPAGDEVVSADLSFYPEVVLPTQRSRATADFVLSAEVASGVPLTLLVREELELLDGTVRREAPYRADLVVYRAPDGAARARFWLAPSASARRLPVRLGAEDVDVLAYGDESVRGNVLGPQGGSVANDDGDQVDVPASALAGPAAVVLHRRQASDLPLAEPAGAAVDAVVELDLGGRELASAASFSLALAAPPAAGEAGVLLQVVEHGGVTYYRAVAELEATANGWATRAIDPADLPWPGVVSGGLFAAARLSSPHGFLRGTVGDLGGVPLGGALITSAAVDWVQISNADGSFVLPLPVGAATVEIAHPANGNGASVEVTVAAADERVDHDPAVQVVAPAVIETTPDDGAVEQPVGIQPTVRFSEPVDGASLDAGIALVLDGSPQAVDFVHQGALVTVVPDVSLLPGHAYELAVGTGVRDIDGYVLPNPVTVTFTTQTVVLPDEVEPSKIVLYEPDGAGQARVTGLPGATPAEHLVFVENRTSFVSTPSVTSGQDGSFETTIQATTRDVLILHVLIPGSNEVLFPLGPFVSDDGKAVWVGAAGATFTTSDDVTLIVDAGTFDGPARVRLDPRPVEAPPYPVAAALETVFAFELDFGGAQAHKALRIHLPATASTPEGVYLLNHLVDVPGTRAWMMQDLLWRDGGILTTEDADVLDPALTPVETATKSAAPGEVASGLEGFDGGGGPLRIRRLGNRLSAKGLVLPPQGYKRYLPGAAFPGYYHVENPLQDIAFFVLPLPSADFFFTAFALSFEGIVTRVNQEVSSLLAFDGVLMPALADRPFELEVRELSTQYLFFEGTFDPAAGGLIELAPDVWGDTVSPVPIGGSPVRFFQLLFTERPASGDLDVGVRHDFDPAAGTLEVEGDPASVHPFAEVVWLNVDSGETGATQAGSDGAFALAVSAQSEQRLVLALGARVAGQQPLEVRFSEGLDDQLAGIDVRGANGQAVSLVPEPVGTASRVRLVPFTGWRAGETYTLALLPELADPLGNTWDRTLEISFEVEAGQTLDTWELTAVRDTARLGSLIFVAADRDGLMVFDASDPTRLEPYVYRLAGSEKQALGLPFPNGDAVRGLAVDPHGRVLVVGGGTTNFGQLKILDPLALDPVAIAAAPDDPAVLAAAFKGSTVISDSLSAIGTQLPAGTPQRVEALSNDQVDSWTAGEQPDPASGLATFPDPGAAGVPYLLTAHGCADPGVPVTLRDTTRGRWNRTDANPAGAAPGACDAADPGSPGYFELDLEVYPGDRLDLVRNVDSLAFVATLGAGIEVVDVNSFYNEAEIPTPAQSNVLGIYSGKNDPDLVLCGDPASDLSGAVLDLGVLLDLGNPHPFAVAGLAAFNGLFLLESNANDFGHLRFLSDACAQDFGNANVSGLEILQDYPFDFDGDGRFTVFEYRDWAILSHRASGILVYDVTDREHAAFAGRVPLPGPVAELSVDRGRRLLYASAYGAGIYVIDLDLVPLDALVDGDDDGIDDRLLETLSLGGNNNAPLGLHPELGLGWAGGLDRGVSSMVLGEPRLVALSEDGSRRVGRLAPLGVPTGPSDPTDPASPERPATFHLLAHLPGFVGDQVKIDVVSVGPGGLEIDGLGDPDLVPGLPRTSLAGEHAVVLERLAPHPWQEGYQIFRSREIVTVADPRAARAYQRTALEDDVCNRCETEPHLLPDSLELLSGHRIAVTFHPETRARLVDVYGDSRLDDAQLELESVPWDVGPSVRQEPTLNPSIGTGDVLPGTLLHSGELSHVSTDLHVRGRGFDFAFTRTYRNQTVGGGPLGPGWDHHYRQRLRPLPSGDVELFDGRGRRELFELETDGSFDPPPGRFVSLDRVATGWVMVDAHHNVLRYDDFGRLVSMTDPIKVTRGPGNGNEMVFHYGLSSRLLAVVDSLDRFTSFEYDDDGHLVRLTDFDGREVDFEYDSAGRLVTVTSPRITTGAQPYPNGLTTRYEYETAAGSLADFLSLRDNLTGLTDARNVRWASLTYTDADGDGREEETTTQLWGAGTILVDYDFTTRTSHVTDRRGHPFEYRHNAAGQLTRFTDPRGAVTLRQYDEEGLVTSMTAPLQRLTSYSYDASDDPRSRGNVTEIRVASDSRGANGSADELVTTIDYEPRTNWPVRIVDPRGAETLILRDDTGLPTVNERPEGSATAIEYNPYGQPVRILNPNGNPTVYEYFDSGPSRGYLRRVTVGGLVTTRYETDARGNVTAVIDPRGVRHEQTWNEADWLVETVAAAAGSSDGAPALSYRTTYLYDENGNLVEERVPFGDGGVERTTNAYTYGELNEQLSAEHETRPGGATVHVTYTYDPNLNLTAVTDPNGNLDLYAYDERNLRKQAVLGAGLVSESYIYNLERQLTQWTDGRGNTWSRQYDGFSRIREIADPLGHLMTYTYDESSNLVEMAARDSQSNLLARTTNAYDLLNRITSSTQLLFDNGGASGDVTRTWAYDPVSNLATYVDGEGRTTVYGYDAAERRISLLDALGNLTASELDGNGNARRTTTEEVGASSSATVETTADYDALNRQVSVVDGLGNTWRYVYDARSNPRLAIDPEGFVTETVYDALDRLETSTEPEGVTIGYTYDANSNLVAYEDALENVTSYFYDALDRLVSVDYPDETTFNYGYDGAHNLTSITDPNGTVIEQIFDLANRMIARQITPGDGVEGVTAESYDWDGLNRMIRAQSGDVVTDMGYDSLSRLVSETSLGRPVGYQHDRVGNETAIAYPSGHGVSQGFDPLDRVASVNRSGSGGPATAATYGYRGPFLTRQRNLGNGLQAVMEFDAARRKTSDLTRSSQGQTVFQESLSWSPRGLKVAQSRGDRNGTGFVFDYDGAYRAVGAVSVADPVGTAPNNQVPVTSDLAELPDAFSFGYDPAQNMLSRGVETDDILTPIDMPVEGSGRNRPSSVNGKALEWDANGNLIRKGDTHFHYDYRNRLVRVSRDLFGDVATYEYDAFNRRVRKNVGVGSTETVWAGWQSLEEYTNGLMSTRLTYGQGLDEIVHAERDLDGDGVCETQFVPLYDDTGNLVAATDANGKPIEKYDYSPFGEVTILVDSTPPEIEQVRLRESQIRIEVSEEVSKEALDEAVASGDLTLFDSTAEEMLEITVDQPVEYGLQARKRLVISIAEAPADGSALVLRLEPEAVRDEFLNLLAAPFEQSFTWSAAADEVLHDSAAPRLVQVLVKDGYLEVELSEEVDLAAATAAITVDGAPLSWTLVDGGYKLRSTTPLDYGGYQLDIGTALLDLDGRALASPFQTGVPVTSVTPRWIVYRASDPREIAASAIGNVHGFHGHPVDPETGLVYVRNRYYDPELGQFITPDPLGYADGPNMYQFAGNNPFNYSDPLGLSWKDSAKFLGSVAWELGKNLAGDVGEMAYGMADMASTGMLSAVHSGYQAFTQSEGSLIERTEAAVAAGNRARMAVITFGFSEAEDPVEHGKQLFKSAIGADQLEAGAHLLVEGITEGNWEKSLEGGALIAGGSGQVILTVASAGGTAVKVGGMVKTSKAGPASQAAKASKGARGAAAADNVGGCKGGNCGVNGQCFVAGTLVMTEAGLRPIEEVEAGDMVLSKDDTTGVEDWRPIVQTFVTPDREVLDLELVTAAGLVESIGVTAEHPFWVAGRGWVDAAQLAVGDELFSVHSGLLRVTGSSWRQASSMVYNFEVEGFHTYFVGESGAWVHNQCNPPARPGDSPFYESSFEAQLKKGRDYPKRSEGRHYQEANRQLHETFEAYPQYARKMENQYPGIREGVRPGARGAHPRKPPTQDLTWHHHPDREGVMQLVPTSHHWARGAVQGILHPNRKGGMENWGGKRKRKK